MSVSQWPRYALRGIAPELRSAIEGDAEREGRAMIEIIREILCSHYELDCEAVVSTSKPREPEPGKNLMVLRLQPELWSAIRADADQQESRYGATDRIIHAILAEYYENGGPPHDN